MTSSTNISIRGYAPEAHLPRLMLSGTNEAAGWNGCVARLYALPQGTSETENPAFHEHHLVVPLSGHTRVEAAFGSTVEQAESRPGNLALLSAGTSARWRSCGSASKLLLVFLDPTLLASIGLQTLEYDPARIELMRRFLTPDPLIYQIAIAMSDELRNGGFAGRLYIESLTHTLALHLLRHHAVFSPQRVGAGGRLAPHHLQRVHEYVDAHLQENLSLATLSALISLSPYHFARLFKRTTGQTVHQFVTARRLAAATRLIKSGSLSVAEIAALVGFADQSHFSRHFRRAFGISPGKLARTRTIILLSSTNLLEDHS